jgi:RsiW-degrading membrane proteinase PrsW (M82 family)
VLGQSSLCGAYKVDSLYLSGQNQCTTTDLTDKESFLPNSLTNKIDEGLSDMALKIIRLINIFLLLFITSSATANSPDAAMKGFAISIPLTLILLFLVLRLIIRQKYSKTKKIILSIFSLIVGTYLAGMLAMLLYVVFE